jgi:hypothetical protein
MRQGKHDSQDGEYSNGFGQYLHTFSMLGLRLELFFFRADNGVANRLPGIEPGLARFGNLWHTFFILIFIARIQGRTRKRTAKMNSAGKLTFRR